MTYAVPGLAALPGPAAHLRRLREILDGGRSCLWVLPDPVVECGDATALLKAVLAGVEADGVPARTADVAKGVGGPLPRADASRRNGPNDRTVLTRQDPVFARGAGSAPLRDPYLFLGLPPEGFGIVDPVVVDRPARTSGEHDHEPLVHRLAPDLRAELAGHADPLARITADAGVVAVRAWLEPSPAEVAALARRFPSVARGSAARPARATGRLLLMARVSDLPPGLLADLDRDPATAVHWWWGALGRADTTAVALRACPADPRTPRERLRDSVRVESVVELAGPDLSLAADLAAEWAGWRDGLPCALAGYFSATKPAALTLPAAATLRDPSASRRPPTALIASWAAGMVDLWEHSLRRSLDPSCPDGPGSTEADVDHRLWTAQLRVLLPAIEAARRRLAVALIAEGVDPAVAHMEIGALRRRLQNDRGRLSDDHWKRICGLAACRNSLAHTRALSDSDLRRLYGVIVQ